MVIAAAGDITFQLLKPESNNQLGKPKCIRKAILKWYLLSVFYFEVKWVTVNLKDKSAMYITGDIFTTSFGAYLVLSLFYVAV
jgi:hypothetical protein